MEHKRISIDNLVKELNEIKRDFGNIPVLTYNENDCTTVFDFIISDTMSISAREIFENNHITYIKDKDYEMWLKFNIDDNAETLFNYIIKKHPELKTTAKNILIDEVYNADWSIIQPVLKHYYLTELPWQRVVLLTNHTL